MKLRLLLLLMPILLTTYIALAAVLPDLKISPNSKTPIDSSALLEVASTSKGILFPRMTSSQRSAISSPADGLLVYDTDFDTILVYTASTTSWDFLIGGSASGSSGGFTGNRALYSNASGDIAASTTSTIELGYLEGLNDAALSNNRLIISSSNSLMELYGITGNRALYSSATGLPLASTTTTIELGYLNGVTSGLQSQIDGKEPSFTTLPISKGGTNSSSALTNNRVIISNAGAIVTSTTTTTELGYLNGSAATNGGVIYGNGTAFRATAAGTTNQVLTSQGAAAPIWATAAAGGGGGGSGAPTVNYVTLDSSYAVASSNNSTAETSVVPWVAYADAAAIDPVDMTGGSPATTITRTTTAGQVLNGAGSFLFTKATGDDQGEGASVLVEVPPGYRGQNAQITVPVKLLSGSLASGLVKLAFYDVTNSVVIGASNTAVEASQPDTNKLITANMFIASTTTQLRAGFHVASTNTQAATFSFDDFTIGPPNNIGNIGQAQFIGSAYIPTVANCSSWSRSSTTIGAFSSDADCPGPTIEINPGPGTIQTTDTDLPKFTINNLPPGTYEVTISTMAIVPSSHTLCLAINDGTDTRGRTCGNPNSTTYESMTIVGAFTYTIAGNRSFEVYGSSDNGTAFSISNNDSDSMATTFSIKRFPIASDTAYRPDQVANSWSGYHDSTCSWARTNTAYGAPTADTTCVFTQRINNNFGTVSSQFSGADYLPGIVFTPSRAGTYMVCAQVSGAPNITAVGATVGINLSDGTTIISESVQTGLVTASYQLFTDCSLYRATSTTAVTLQLQSKASAGTITIGGNGGNAVEWSIFQVDQQMPMPNIVNSVSNSSTGITRVETAKLNCDSAAVITSQHGSWISSIGNVASGACAVTLASGIFSSAPYCVASDIGANPSIIGASSSSATVVAIDCDQNDGTDCTSYDVNLTCIGPK